MSYVVQLRNFLSAQEHKRELKKCQTNIKSFGVEFFFILQNHHVILIWTVGGEKMASYCAQGFQKNLCTIGLCTSVPGDFRQNMDSKMESEKSMCYAYVKSRRQS